MFRKMMKHLTNNLGLKLLSVLFSVVLWLVVVSIADPDATKSFSIPVEVINKDIITEMGKVPSIVKDTDIALFYITGSRSYVDSMSADDFTATADLSQADFGQEGKTKLVPIEVAAKKNSTRIEIVCRTVNMQITLEDRMEKKFVISAEASGTPAEGYAIGNVEVTPNLLKVSGPVSVVSEISRVGASINVDGISSDVSDNVIPVLYDESGTVISSDLLEMNQSAVTIKAQILASKNVPVRCGVSGTPAAGFELREVECAPEHVLVKGQPSVLNAISAINIPESVINVDGAREDIETTVDISPYLEELGISLVDEGSGQIAVTAVIEQKQTKSFDLLTDDIKITGLDSRYELSFGDEKVTLSIRALGENMDAFSMEDVEAVLNVGNLAPGTYMGQLAVTLPGEQYELARAVNVQYTIVDKNAPQEGEDADMPNPGEGQDENEDENQDDEQDNDTGNGTEDGGTPE